MSDKRVALTTWFNHQNYGTALQVIALSEVVKSLGYSVDVVDYTPHNTRYTNEAQTFFSNSERVIDAVRSEKFESFVRKRLNFTLPCKDDDDFQRLNGQYHAFIAGSDQVWSPIVFDSRYYLDYVLDNRRKVSYASSFGVPEVKNHMIRERMTNLMSQFSRLSVREDTGASLVEKLLGSKPEKVLDPTLLLNREQWEEIIPKRKKSGKPYILCYFLGDNDNQWKHVQAIAASRKLPVKIIPTFVKDSEYGEMQEGVGPAEMVQLIEQAELVLTDSFHGVLLSLIHATDFYAFERFRSDDPVSQNSRIYNILEIIRAKKKLIGFEEPIRGGYAETIDFASAHATLEKKRKSSIAYLRESLEISTPKVSVIVPAYKVERYIDDCLRSIANQTYKNIEVIVVDDGSPDRSGEIAEKRADEDGRFTVLHTENGGVSAARNAGMSAASGDYVVFIDPDDVVEEHFVEYMLSLIENKKTNIAASLNAYTEYSEEQNILPSTDRIEIYQAERAVEGIYAWFFPLPVWNKIYKRSLLVDNSLRFLTDLHFAEGMTFNVMAMQHSGPIAVGRRQLYFQTFNPDSATRSTDIPRWETCFKAYEYQARHSRIDNDRIKRARAFHAWLCNSSIARQIYKADEQRKYALQLAKYKLKMRLNPWPVLRANMSWDQKKKYLHMAFFTKRDLSLITSAELERVKANDLSEINSMPWERPKKAPEPIVVDPPEPTEIERLRDENARLLVELESMLSIKRSARLFVGNIRRRLKNGRKR